MPRIKLLWEIIKNYPLHEKNFHENFEISVKFFFNRLIYKKEQFLTPIFLSELNSFFLLDSKVNFFSSKEIIEFFQPERKKELDDVYDSEIMKKREEAEKRGVRDILEGKYYVPK